MAGASFVLLSHGGAQRVGIHIAVNAPSYPSIQSEHPMEGNILKDYLLVIKHPVRLYTYLQEGR